MAVQKFTISRDDSVYEAFPDVVLTPKGKLLCMFTEMTHHGDRSYTRVVYCTSQDRGRTWSGKNYLSESTLGTGYSYDCVRMSYLPDGRLSVVCNRGSRPQEGKAPQAPVIVLWLGDAEGTQWEGPFDTPAYGIVPDRIVTTRTGRLLLSAHYPDAETGKLAQQLWYSDDNLRTWQGPVVVGKDPQLNLCEVSIVQHPQGPLVALMRENSGKGYDCYKAISRDDGESWEPLHTMPLPGCHRPTAGFLQSGNVLVTYRFMQGGKGWLGFWTQNMFAALTSSQSLLRSQRDEQWSRIMPLDYDRSPVSDLGYTGWVQFPDGEIYVVSYIVDDAPKAQIRGYSLRESDFCLGEIGEPQE